MATLEQAFSEVREALAEEFGRAADNLEGLAPFEAMIAVLLARSAGLKKWRPALQALRDADLLAPVDLNRAEIPEIADALNEQGVHVSAIVLGRLKGLARWLVERDQGRLDWLFDPHRSTGWLRGEIESISGIGIGGADAILLHALRRPSYSVDRPTCRVLARHGWVDPSESYDEIRDRLVDLAQEAANPDFSGDDATTILLDLAHGIDQLGRRFCPAAAPHCDGCPLERLLPEEGPRTLDE
jgi:endonuclease-3 related protein